MRSKDVCSRNAWELFEMLTQERERDRWVQGMKGAAGRNDAARVQMEKWRNGDRMHVEMREM